MAKKTLKKMKISKRKSTKNIMDVKKGFNEKSIKNISSAIYALIFIYIIGIIFIGYIISYVKQIKDCQCFIEKNKEFGTNINYIYYLEILIFILYTYNLLSLIYMSFLFNSTMKGGASILMIQRIAYIIGLLINGYLVYNVYKLSEIPEDDCECLKSSLKYLLYIQSGIILLGLISSGYILFIK
jgi:hypothetical protein